MSREKMPDLIVLLPGITGSVLRRNGKVVWGFTKTTVARALFTLGHALEKDLALPHDDPEVDDLDDGIIADELMPDLHMLPGIWKIDGYARIAEVIKATFDVEEGQNFFRFPYDWRRHNKVAARKLSRLCHDKLKAWRERSGNGDAKVILVAHSMGGLVSRYFLECMEGWKITKALITFGTPYRGSLNALDGIVNGVGKIGIDFTDAARQFTAMYQLLPIYKCVDDGSGALKRVSESKDLPHLNAKMAAAALAFHREIEDAQSRNAKLREYQEHRYRIFPVVGTVQPTHQSAVLKRGKLEMLNSYEGQDMGGDGTVPRVSATPIEAGDDVSDAMYAATKHGSLQNADAVLVQLTGILTGMNLSLGQFRYLVTPVRVALDVEDAYLPDRQIVVRARPEREGVSPVLRIWRSGEDRPVLTLEPELDNDGWHAAEVKGLQPGAYRVSVEGVGLDPAEDAFVVLDPHDDGTHVSVPGQGSVPSDEPVEQPAIRWDRTSGRLVVAADRTLLGTMKQVVSTRPQWVVLSRVHPVSHLPYHYAFRTSELVEFAQDFPERQDWTLEDALCLQERMSSVVARAGRTLGEGEGAVGPASGRVVDFDAAGEVTGIGELEQEFEEAAGPQERSAGEASAGEAAEYGGAGDADEVADGEVPCESADADDDDSFSDLDLGPVRGGGGLSGSTAARPPASVAPGAGWGAWENSGPSSVPPRPSAPQGKPPKVEVTLSAEGPEEVSVGANARIPFLIELTAEAMPLRHSTTASVKEDLPIVVSLSVENENLRVLRGSEIVAAVPGSGRPSTGFFAVMGMKAGPCRLAVSFMQGGSELGRIGMAVEVVNGESSSATARANISAAPRVPDEDDKLALLVEQRSEGGRVFYEYTLHSEALGLAYRKVRSQPLLDAGHGPAANSVDFVKRIYKRVTIELNNRDDLKQLQRDTRALGAALCRELFDPEVAKILWPLRDRLSLVQVVSWEPYIPWELVRLRDPDTGDIDEKFLCEYGLVRTLSDHPPCRDLQLKRWRYFGARFPNGSFPPIGAELDFFEKDGPGHLREYGIRADRIPAERDAFYDAIHSGSFDVLHICCHAEAEHDAIDRASLVLGDEASPGSTQVRLIAVDSLTVDAEIRLKERKPIVFLNACETGRVGALLTAWGGWPNVFLRGGAGVFVGTAWPVRDKPASVFAKTFYKALLDGDTLAEAADAARQEAKKLGDASWLAFKVYGHPRARKVS